MSVMLFADDPVVIRSAIPSIPKQFGITKVDRVDGAKSGQSVCSKLFQREWGSSVAAELPLECLALKLLPTWQFKLRSSPLLIRSLG